MTEYDENNTAKAKKKKDRKNKRHVDTSVWYLYPLPLKFYNTTFRNNIHDISAIKVIKSAW